MPSGLNTGGTSEHIVPQCLLMVHSANHAAIAFFIRPLFHQPFVHVIMAYARSPSVLSSKPHCSEIFHKSEKLDVGLLVVMI